MSYPPQGQNNYPPAYYQPTAPQGMAQPPPGQYSQQYPAGYPQPGYYQQGPPPPAGYGVQTTQVVVQQPAAIKSVSLEQVPVSMQCPHCHATIITKVERNIGSTTWIYCLLFSCFCCCCVPFCLDCAKDASHSCPNCKNHLGTFKQPVVQTGGGGGSSGQNYDFHYGGPGDDGTGGGPVDHGGGGDD